MTSLSSPQVSRPRPTASSHCQLSHNAASSSPAQAQAPSRPRPRTLQQFSFLYRNSLPPLSPSPSTHPSSTSASSPTPLLPSPAHLPSRTSAQRLKPSP